MSCSTPVVVNFPNDHTNVTIRCNVGGSSIEQTQTISTPPPATPCPTCPNPPPCPICPPPTRLYTTIAIMGFLIFVLFLVIIKKHKKKVLTWHNKYNDMGIRKGTVRHIHISPAQPQKSVFDAVCVCFFCSSYTTGGAPWACEGHTKSQTAPTTFLSIWIVVVRFQAFDCLVRFQAQDQNTGVTLTVEEKHNWGAKTLCIKVNAQTAFSEGTHKTNKHHLHQS